MASDDKARGEAGLSEAGRDFIRDIVKADLDSGRVKGAVTRFPPEPNGYLHIGHAKSICLNFGIAEEFGGRCHLRFDDTNPVKEEQEYIDAIEADVRWLGFDWGKHLYHASDYFEQLYAWAEDLIRAGKAYVDDQTPHDMRVNRGTMTEPGKNSPFRDREVDENLDLFGGCGLVNFQRRPRFARQDRYGIRQYQYARSGALSDPRQPSANGHGVEDLPEL
jgi:glutaminyl-tRNA synthetase